MHPAPHATPPSKLAHIVFRSSRYQEMVRFYQELLCAHVTFGNDVLTFLTYDDEHHRIAILNFPDLAQQQPGVAGVHHIAFTYDSMAQLVGNYERVKQLGITPIWCTNHGPTTSLYYRDPDGNQLELQVENFASIEESTQFFFSPEFSENPIGVDFDPEELARRLHAGESEQSIKQRVHAGARGFDAAVKIV